MVSNKVSNTDGGTGANPRASFSGANDVMYQDPLMKRPAPAWMVEAIEEFIRKTQRKPIWEVVDFAIQFWATKHPKEHKKYLGFMKRYRANRKNEYGSTKDLSQRTLLELPREVNYFIQKFLAERIEEYGAKKFWHDFARRYPAFRGGDKL